MTNFTKLQSKPVDVVVYAVGLSLAQVGLLCACNAVALTIPGLAYHQADHCTNVFRHDTSVNKFLGQFIIHILTGNDDPN